MMTWLQRHEKIQLHGIFISGPILMFLGSLESHGVATGSTRDKPYMTFHGK